MRWACSKIRISDFQFQSFNQHFPPFAIRFFLSASVLRKHVSTGRKETEYGNKFREGTRVAEGK